MTEQESLYHDIAQEIAGAEKSQMFGKPCYKVNGKAFVCFFQEKMVFKLTGDTHKGTLELTGSKLFDPSGKGRPMKEWVQVSYEHSGQWKHFTEKAFTYVAASTK
jgi:hypothetical protein